jgi:hypothetical protein
VICVALTVNAVKLPWERRSRTMATADKLAQAVSLDMTGYWRPTVRTYLGQATSRRIGTSRGRPTSFVGEVHRADRRAGGNATGARHGEGRR